MSGINFHIVKSDDKKLINHIADWYLSEWNIPIDTTIQRLSNFPINGIPFQIVMTFKGIPITTGGIYCHVSLLDREPRFKEFKPWLALVYTAQEQQGKGYGALLCEQIQNQAKKLGIKELFLFTHTAESLYKRLGWQEMERLESGGKNIVIMNKKL